MAQPKQRGPAPGLVQPPRTLHGLLSTVPGGGHVPPSLPGQPFLGLAGPVTLGVPVKLTPGLLDDLNPHCLCPAPILFMAGLSGHPGPVPCLTPSSDPSPWAITAPGLHLLSLSSRDALCGPHLQSPLLANKSPSFSVTSWPHCLPGGNFHPHLLSPASPKSQMLGAEPPGVYMTAGRGASPAVCRQAGASSLLGLSHQLGGGARERLSFSFVAMNGPRVGTRAGGAVP